MMAKHHGRFQMQVISTGAGADSPQNAFITWDKGGETRSVMSLLEAGRWEFHQSGNVQPFEAVNRYTSRRREDRLTRDTLVGYLRSVGADVTSTEFWSSKGDATYYLPFH
jgi:hypothetical protein